MIKVDFCTPASIGTCTNTVPSTTSYWEKICRSSHKLSSSAQTKMFLSLFPRPGLNLPIRPCSQLKFPVLTCLTAVKALMHLLLLFALPINPLPLQTSHLKCRDCVHNLNAGGCVTFLHLHLISFNRIHGDLFCLMQWWANSPHTTWGLAKHWLEQTTKMCVTTSKKSHRVSN